MNIGTASTIPVAREFEPLSLQPRWEERHDDSGKPEECCVKGCEPARRTRPIDCRIAAQLAPRRSSQRGLGCRFFGPFWLRYHYRLRLQTSRNSSALRILPLIVDSIYAFGSRTNRRP